jgi:hypothetical protein
MPVPARRRYTAFILILQTINRTFSKASSGLIASLHGLPIALRSGR